MPIIRIDYIFILIYVVFAIIPECGGVEISSQNKKKAEMVLRGMEDSIVRINSGVCRISGRTVKPGKEVIEDDIFVAFDYKKNYYRLDNGNKGKSLLTPDYYYEIWKPDSYDASAHRFTHADMEHASWLNMVDIQAIPYFVPIGEKEPFDFQKNYQPKIFVHKLVDYKEEEDVFYLKFDMVRAVGASPMQMEYWLSKKYGYLPIHIEYSVGYVMDISWQSMNDTNVPVAYSQKSKQGFGVEWKIVWQQVNEQVSSGYFDESKLSEKVLPLFSTELGERVQIGMFGENGALLNTEDTSTNYDYLRHILMGVGIFLIVLALSKKAYDWWKQ